MYLCGVSGNWAVYKLSMPVLTGRMKNIPRPLSLCSLCDNFDLGDEYHLLLECSHITIAGLEKSIHHAVIMDVHQCINVLICNNMSQKPKCKHYESARFISSWATKHVHQSSQFMYSCVLNVLCSTTWTFTELLKVSFSLSANPIYFRLALFSYNYLVFHV